MFEVCNILRDCVVNVDLSACQEELVTNYSYYRSPDSTFGIATACVLDGRVLSRQCKICVISTVSRPTLGHTQPLIKSLMRNPSPELSILSATSY
jgi:hypothetical protein